MAVEGKLPAVPETILKRRKRQAESRAIRAKDAVKSKVGWKRKKLPSPSSRPTFLILILVSPLFHFHQTIAHPTYHCYLATTSILAYPPN